MRERKPPTVAGIWSFCLVVTHGMPMAKKPLLEMLLSIKPSWTES
jgi:hypothetical protein